MDRLASCYFCGTAMDDTLREYRVVPAELRDDDVTTATLCPSCHDKLERLLAPVVGAAGGDGVTLDARRQTPESADGRPAEAQSGTAEPDERAAGPAEGGGEPAGDEREGAGGTDPDLVDVDGPLADGTASDEDDDKRVRITHTGGGDEAADGGDESGGDADTDAGANEPAPARTTVSALEHNKVMRLLQNREFPVDRAEIQTVAANAYGLAESECAEVIDLAIDRGLIAEEDGQLVRPE